MQEEHIMQMMIAEVARDDRLEERARKRSAWLDRQYRMEADVMTTRMGMLTVLDWEESMEVDVLTRDVTKDVEEDTIMMDKSARKPNFALKSKRKFKGRMKRVWNIVMKLGVVEAVDDKARGNKLSNGVQVVQGHSNVSPRNVSEMECYWGQDEHPLLKGTHEEKTETGLGASAMVMEPGNERMNVCKDTQLEVMMRPVGRTK